MKRSKLLALPLALAITHSTPLIAHELKSKEGIKLSQAVPEKEKKHAKKMNFEGPQKTTGIKNVRLMGTVALAGQFDDLENRMLRAREIDIEPGGKVAVHQHNKRPGVAYMVSGELIEHRKGKKPVVKKAGDTAFEWDGVVHWWENKSDKVARIIVVDLVPKDIK